MAIGKTPKLAAVAETEEIGRGRPIPVAEGKVVFPVAGLLPGFLADC
jgi:hypothetical protein